MSAPKAVRNPEEQDWEALGQAAAALGFEYDGEKHEVIWVGHDERGFKTHVADFSDRLTAKACELWVEDVAREVYGARLQSVTFEIGIGNPGDLMCVQVGWWRKWKDENGCSGEDWEDDNWHSAIMPEACIAAVKAMSTPEATPQEGER